MGWRHRRGQETLPPETPSGSLTSLKVVFTPPACSSIISSPHTWGRNFCSTITSRQRREEQSRGAQMRAFQPRRKELSRACRGVNKSIYRFVKSQQLSERISALKAVALLCGVGFFLSPPHLKKKGEKPKAKSEGICHSTSLERNVTPSRYLLLRRQAKADTTH